MKLGIDTYSLNATGWSSFEFLDFASRNRLEVVQFANFSEFKKMEDGKLREIKSHAESLRLELELNAAPLCPTSVTMKLDPGETLEDRIKAVLRVASVLGVRVVNGFLGKFDDRFEGGGISHHIQSLIRHLKTIKPLFKNQGVKLSLENHAGDLLGVEVRNIIEEMGEDWMGACIDPGNSTFVLENPQTTLRHLFPYVLTSHIRDSRIWKHPRGAVVEWVGMGKGNVGIHEWCLDLICRCPSGNFLLEIIPGGRRVLRKYFEEEFWSGYPDRSAEELAEFEKILRNAPDFEDQGDDLTQAPALSKSELAELQIRELEKSLAFCRERYGLGVRDETVCLK